MDPLEQRVADAKADPAKLDALVADYLPFLKKQIAASPVFGMEYDDCLSLAMLAFVSCVGQYDPGKGSFLAFAGRAVRNRLIDEARRLRRWSRERLPLEAETDDKLLLSAGEEAALSVYSRERERASLAEEIKLLSAELAEYGVAFGELTRICPKQERSRRQCMALAEAVVAGEEMRRSLFAGRRLPQTQLAGEFGLSPKTVEKHRKYIVALCVILWGDYPHIRAFLPRGREVD